MGVGWAASPGVSSGAWGGVCVFGVWAGGVWPGGVGAGGVACAHTGWADTATRVNRAAVRVCESFIVAAWYEFGGRGGVKSRTLEAGNALVARESSATVTALKTLS